MIKEIDLNKFIDIIGNQKNKKDIKLKIEGKKLKSGHAVNIKSLIVTEALFNSLGLKGEIVIKDPGPSKPKKPARMDRIENSLNELKDIVLKGFSNVNKEISIIKTDVNTLKTDMIEVKADVNILKTDMQAMKNTPTMKRELNAQKRLKTLKQKQ